MTDSRLGKSLTEPEPEFLQEVPRDLLRPVLRIQSRLSGPDISICGVHNLGSFEDLPETVEEEENRNANVSGEERGELI